MNIWMEQTICDQNWEVKPFWTSSIVKQKILHTQICQIYKIYDLSYGVITRYIKGGYIYFKEIMGEGIFIFGCNDFPKYLILHPVINNEYSITGVSPSSAQWWTLTVLVPYYCTYIHKLHLLFIIEVIHSQASLANEEVEPRITLYQQLLCGRWEVRNYVNGIHIEPGTSLWEVRDEKSFTCYIHIEPATRLWEMRDCVHGIHIEPATRLWEMRDCVYGIHIEPATYLWEMRDCVHGIHIEPATYLWEMRDYVHGIHIEPATRLWEMRDCVHCIHIEPATCLWEIKGVIDHVHAKYTLNQQLVYER